MKHLYDIAFSNRYFHNNTDIEFVHIFGIHLNESIQYY